MHTTLASLDITRSLVSREYRQVLQRGAVTLALIMTLTQGHKGSSFVDQGMRTRRQQTGPRLRASVPGIISLPFIQHHHRETPRGYVLHRTKAGGDVIDADRLLKVKGSDACAAQ
jgi:hypothetical protein